MLRQREDMKSKPVPVGMEKEIKSTILIYPRAVHGLYFSVAVLIVNGDFG
jgi:hypothetical protein